MAVAGVHPGKAAGVRKQEASVLSPAMLARSVRDEALRLAQDKFAAYRRDSGIEVLLRQPGFFDQFKYGLACGVAEALAANDGHVQAVYSYEPSLNPDSELAEEAPLDPMVHLLVLVTTSSAALEAFAVALDRALTESLADLPSETFAECKSVLDVNVTTENDVRLGAGHAALLSSVFAPPLKIWRREA